jgi:phosphatidylglycerophosphatase A
MIENKGLNRVALLIAEFFYCGCIPYAPGTVGSLASLIIWGPSVYYAWPLFIKLMLLVLLFFIGVWASRYGIAYYQTPDPKQVVIDEVVGQGIPFLVINAHFLEIIIAFVLFRFFDVLKPWPIKAIERRFLNEWGIMLDDVLAGIFAMIVIVLGKYLILSL